MRLQAFFAAALAALAPAIVTAGEAPITFSKLWTHTHATAGQLSEIPAYDARTHTIWVAGVVGVDVLDAAAIAAAGSTAASSRVRALRADLGPRQVDGGLQHRCIVGAVGPGQGPPHRQPR